MVRPFLRITSPLNNESSPQIQPSKVLLPAPFAPTRPILSPSLISKLTPLNITLSAYRNSADFICNIIVCLIEILTALRRQNFFVLKKLVCFLLVRLSRTIFVAEKEKLEEIENERCCENFRNQK